MPTSAACQQRPQLGASCHYCSMPAAGATAIRIFPTSPLSSCALSVTRLNSRCPLQVRNAASTIVQLTYGDDGLDPVHMESKDGSPIDLGRALSFIQATHPRHVPCHKLCNSVMSTSGG